MKVLVSGSSGFIGSALVRALRGRGHDVCGLSRIDRDGSLRADLLEPQSLRRVLHQFEPELVYHLAAQTDLKAPAQKGYPVNVTGVSNLLDAIETEGAVRRVIWASSQLVNRHGSTPRPDVECDPADAYGASKAEGERLVRERDGAGREWVIFRSTTIWGPGMSDHYANILRMIRNGRYFHIGHRRLRKSYSYIDNLAAQLVTLGEASRDEVHRRTFYLADSEPIELRDWHNRFAAAFGRRIPTVPLAAARLAAWAGDFAGLLGIRSPITTKRLSNMMTEYVHDVSDIEALHGMTRISSEEGVRRTVEWLETSIEPGPKSRNVGA